MKIKEKKIIIFDDGLQDKKVKFDLEFVCFDTSNWIGNGNLIPSGPLREKLNKLGKYDGIFLKDEENKAMIIIEELKKQKIQIPVFTTYYYPLKFEKLDLTKNYLIFSGIGNPNSFKLTLLKNNLKIVDEITFPDHFEYNKDDIQRIKKRANILNAKILTTEKDYVRIPKDEQVGIEYLEIELKFDEEQKLINFLKLKNL